MSKNFTLNEARLALQLDKADLDEEMVRHPMLLAEVGRRHIESNNERDRAKDRLEEIEAHAYLVERKKAEAKATDYAIKAAARTSKEVIQAQEDYRDAKEEAAQWDVIWSAFQQRSFMLNKLAELWTTQYYSSDSYQRPSYQREQPKNRKDKTSRRRIKAR